MIVSSLYLPIRCLLYASCFKTKYIGNPGCPFTLFSRESVSSASSISRSGRKFLIASIVILLQDYPKL